jgi:hypothetical protein
MPSPPNDPIPPTISALRRQLITAQPDQDKAPRLGDDMKSETIDFDAPPAAPTGYDEMEAMLARYQAEKGIPREEPRPTPSANGLRRLSALGVPRGTGGTAGNTRQSLPPLTNQPRSELERLKSEVAELRQLNNEYRELLEANDPTVWEQKVADAENCLADRDVQLTEMRGKVDTWEAKFKTHRFVPHDEESAQMADELDKERAKLVSERKQLDKERQQLKEDEDTLMKQMRDMEVSMAKDRAELARQRTEIQRLQAEVKHELEILHRGDAGVKERLSQFQRRAQEPPRQASPAAPQPAPPQAPAAADPPKPRESAVFKRFFGQS